jgi:hypothetical protein
LNIDSYNLVDMIPQNNKTLDDIDEGLNGESGEDAAAGEATGWRNLEARRF